uniref:CUB domain-containing protein n=1 Tax=Elaeophora elaphi TaxID=1147741 RepID=A0A0R3RZ52_9BILA
MEATRIGFSPLSIHFITYFTFITNAYHTDAGMNRLDECKCRSANFGIDVTAGELKSPGYPTKYCNFLNCKYETAKKRKIDAIPDQSIHLSIVSFETELRHDFLEIHQTFIFANTQYSARIATLSGKDIGWPSFASSIGSGFILKFITDSTETFAGFHARFNRINTTSSTNSCPTFFYEATGEDQTLPSPPTNFAYFSGCTYMLNTSEGHGIKLNLKSLAPKAKLIVYETENYQVPSDHIISPLSEEFLTALLIRNIGLMDATPKEIISRTNSILIQAKILQRGLLQGKARSTFLFEAQFSRTDSPCECFSKSYIIQVDHPTTLSSPGFPFDYCDKLDCEAKLQLDQYAIDSTHHNAIIVEIHAFSLEHGSDFVHFLDRSKHSSRHLISRTGELSTSRNRFFTFSGESAVLRMITDSTVTNNGFNMTISAVQKKDDCRCKGEAQPLEFSSLAGTFSFSAPADCGFLDCFFQFNRPVTALDTDRVRLVVNITYTFKDGEEEFLEVLTNINNYNIIPSHRNERDITIFEPTLAESGTEEITNDTPMMIWYHLASDINGRAAQFDFDYKWKSICECGRLELEAKKDLWKQLTSPDYPSHYCNLMKCQYLISAPLRYIVVVNITELALEPNEDVLAIFDGTNITDRRIRITSGVEIFTDLLRSTAETMTNTHQWMTKATYYVSQNEEVAGMALPLLDSPICPMKIAREFEGTSSNHWIFH